MKNENILQSDYITDEEKVQILFNAIYEWLIENYDYSDQFAYSIIADYVQTLKGNTIFGPETQKRVNVIRKTFSGYTSTHKRRKLVIKIFEDRLFYSEYGGKI